MPVLKAARVILLAFIALLAVGAAQATAAPRMPIGFFDDPTFRWSPDREVNLERAAAAGASVIHTTASWPTIAPTKPANAADGSDSAYHLDDLDELVQKASLNGMRVMIDINGTPKWANGGKGSNRLPKSLSTLTTFARMLATRYNGANGHGYVGLYSVWNEPNLGLFLEPQFSGSGKKFKIVGPANYAKLYKAAYAGIKAGNHLAQVAVGETSARGRDKPLKGVSDSIAPGTFAKYLAKVKGLKFDAWAHHPYPTTPNMRPLQLVRYPNVTLSTMPKFEKDLHTWFHRTVPIWITEYGHETKPAEPHGVSYATQSAYARQALSVARKDPDIQMFIWFVFRDSKGNPWQSGLEQPSGAAKPAYAGFGAIARLVDGVTITVKAGSHPVIPVYLPTMAYYNGPGASIGMTYKITNGSRTVDVAQPVLPLRSDQAVGIPLGFAASKGRTYTVTVTANDSGGHIETSSTTVNVSSLGSRLHRGLAAEEPQDHSDRRDRGRHADRAQQDPGRRRERGRAHQDEPGEHRAHEQPAEQRQAMHEQRPLLADPAVVVDRPRRELRGEQERRADDRGPAVGRAVARAAGDVAGPGERDPPRDHGGEAPDRRDRDDGGAPVGERLAEERQATTAHRRVAAHSCDDGDGEDAGGQTRARRA